MRLLRQCFQVADQLSSTCILLGYRNRHVSNEIPGHMSNVEDEMALTASLLSDVADRCLVYNDTPVVVYNRLRMLVALISPGSSHGWGLYSGPTATLKVRSNRLHQAIENESGIRPRLLFLLYNDFLKSIAIEITRSVSYSMRVDHIHMVYRTGLSVTD